MTNTEFGFYCSLSIRKMKPSFLFVFIFTIFPHSILSTPTPRKHFAFIETLEGSQKGETVQGLNQLKQYLKKFGYLNPNKNPNYVKPTRHDHEHADHENDVFDEVLESAIKTYQLNYRLNPTGKLDTPTVNQMMKPRCGNPDIINGKNFMLSDNKKKNTHSLLHIVKHFATYPGNIKWPLPSKLQLTYRFNSTANPDPYIPIETQRAVMWRAFQTWSGVTPFTFTEAPGIVSDIEIGFKRGDHGDVRAFDGPLGTIAHSFAPTDGRFHIDADEKWTDDPDSNSDSIDLESVSVHEIGHILGLQHSSDPDAVMFASISAGAKKRQLNQDDIDGIHSLYG